MLGEIKINEIFFSIQGESSYVGYPTVFVRTTGCNLRCTYCDTKYSYHEGDFQSLNSVVEQIKKFPTRYVCLTGGEPLLQKSSLDLMRQLCDLGYIVSLETSGSKSCRDVDSRVKVVLDVKTPDSGEPNSFLEDNLNFINSSYDIKFVICSETDFDWSENFCKTHGLYEKAQVFFSPSFDQITPKWLAERILSSQSKARMQMQLHKYIWEPSQRGV